MTDNLNRIKRVLSARQGTEIPKFQRGAKFKGVENGTNIYSNDGINWYLDKNLTSLYKSNYPNIISVPISHNIDLGGQNYTVPMSGNGPYEYIKNNQNLQSLLKNSLETVQRNKFVNEASEYVNSLVNRSIYSNNSEINLSQRNPIVSKEFTLPQHDVKNANKIAMETSARMQLDEEDQKLSNQMQQERVQKGQTFMTGMNVISTIGGAIGASQQATDSDLTKGITTGYNGVADTVSSFGPYGQIIGGAMKAVGALGDMAQAMGGGTDQQTKLDSWMDSPLFSWNIGMFNGFAGKNTDSFGIDQEALTTVGSSYGGTANSISEAAESADKKYGLFSSKARKKANENIAKIKAQQSTMTNIADQATDQRLAVQSMGEQAGLAYSLMTDGGYNQKYTYAAKEGGILDWNPSISLEWEPQIELNWELPTFKEGGNIEISEELDWIPTLQKGNKVRTIEELIEYAKKENPRFIQRLSEEPRGIKFIDDEGNDAEGSHYMESMGEYVVPRIQEINGELKFLSKEDAINRSIETGNYLKMNPEEAIIFAEQYKQGWPEFFKKFKKGGSLSNIPEIEETTQKNVIPEGALHKNKHHMEHAEGLTKKGIPVIDEEGEQQAEIEHSEIIFTLEVTKKLEEYYQIFYSEESSNKEKEQAALDAGKLLVYQILENTEDRTGLIDSCKQGGTLTLKKSTDDLIEELFDWEPTIVIVEEKEVKEQSKNKSDKEEIKKLIKEAIIELLTT